MAHNIDSKKIDINLLHLATENTHKIILFLVGKPQE